MYVPANSDITVSIWRKTDNRKVWYEWVVETFGWNAGLSVGERRRMRLGVSDGGSSKEGGCLM